MQGRSVTPLKDDTKDIRIFDKPERIGPLRTRSGDGYCFLHRLPERGKGFVAGDFAIAVALQGDHQVFRSGDTRLHAGRFEAPFFQTRPCDQPIFAGGERQRQAVTGFAQGFSSVAERAEVLPAGIEDIDGKAVDLIGKPVGKLHIVIVAKTNGVGLRAFRQIVMNARGKDRQV